MLGQLKGGAMKFGQALSVFEAALPEEMAGPYRQALTKLQESAPPLPAASVHRVLADQLGPEWRSRFLEFDDTPAAAASIGQVHRALWKGRAKGGRPVAVKIQYPGAGDALLSDLKQLSRLGAMFKAIQPGPRHQAAAGRAARADQRRARLRARGQGAAGVRGGVRR